MAVRVINRAFIGVIILIASILAIISVEYSARVYNINGGSTNIRDDMGYEILDTWSNDTCHGFPLCAYKDLEAHFYRSEWKFQPGGYFIDFLVYFAFIVAFFAGIDKLLSFIFKKPEIQK